MEKGEFVVLGVILVGLFLFMSFSSDLYSGNAVDAPNGRDFCKSSCGGNAYFKQPLTMDKSAYTISKNDYFIVDSGEDVAFFRFLGVQRNIESDYIVLEKLFLQSKYNSVVPKLSCKTYDYVNIPFNYDLPSTSIPVTNTKDGNVFDFNIPVGNTKVSARLLSYIVGGKENLKLHVDLDNDRALGGDVKISEFYKLKLCSNVNPY